MFIIDLGDRLIEFFKKKHSKNKFKWFDGVDQKGHDNLTSDNLTEERETH